MAISTAKAKEKAKNAAKKTGETIMKNPKTTLYVVLGVAATYLAYKLVTGAKSAADKAADIFTGADIDKNIEVGNSLTANPQNITISQTQAKQYASQLLTAFNWKITFPTIINGTDNDVVEAIFKKITADDFKLIYKEFGYKHYNGFGSPPENFGGGIQATVGIAEERDLVYWLAAEIKPSWFSSTYDIVKEKVEKAGFVFA